MDSDCLTSASVVVTVRRNLNFPVFDDPQYTFLIAETETPYSTAFGTVRATDGDRLVRFS